MIIKDFSNGKKFSKNGVPMKSGAEFHCDNQAKLFLELGDRITVFTKKKYFSNKVREWKNGIEICRLHGGIRWLEIMVRLLTTHRKIDCIYIFGTPKFAVWAILLNKYFLHKKTLLVLTGVAEIFEREKNWRTRILSNCDYYIGGSQELVDGLINKGKIKKENVMKLPHGVDTMNRFFPISLEEKRTLRIKYNIPINKKIILFCARVVPDKGTDILIKMWKKLYDGEKNIHLLVVGGGVNSIISEIKELGNRLNNSITVLGEVDNPEDFYKLSDIYFFPSRYEGISTSMMEAMASGLPIVASNIGGNVDLIFENKNGLLVDVENVDGYCEALKYLLNNSSKTHEYGRFSRKYAQNYLDCRLLLKPLRDKLQ